jgi:hypothetical protein
MQFLMGLWSIPLLWIFHEGGHWLACYLLTGKSLMFKWHFEYEIIPVGLWYMPHGLTKHQKNIIWASGFGLEFLAIPFLPWIYGVCAVIHFATYFLRSDNAEAEFWLRLFKIERWFK